jgi:mono/diheme cytochrome c family protein
VLSAEQIQAVSQYVMTDLAVIPMTQGNIGEGGQLFRMYCATCHRTAVRSNPSDRSSSQDPEQAEQWYFGRIDDSPQAWQGKA